MEKGWLRVMVRYPLVVLVEERWLLSPQAGGTPGGGGSSRAVGE